MKTSDFNDDNYNELFNELIEVVTDKESCKELAQDIIKWLEAKPFDTIYYGEYGNALEMMAIPNKWGELEARPNAMGIYIPEERLVQMGFSGLGYICALDNDHNVSDEQLALIVDIVDWYGFLYIPSKYLNKKFDPPDRKVKWRDYDNWTWWQFLILL